MSDTETIPGSLVEVTPTLEVANEFGLGSVEFLKHSRQRGFRFNSFVSRSADLGQRDELDQFGESLWCRSVMFLEERVIAMSTGPIAHVNLGKGSVDITIAAESREAGEAARDLLAGFFEEPVEDPRLVPITFWSGSEHGGSRASRRNECDEWDEIGSSYCEEAQGLMNRLVDVEGPEGGRLILWYGPPGTGKTHAVRALARAWQDWCVVHLITDPEKFLESSSYAMDVLTSNDLERKRNRNWHLVVLEDSGELLRNDAREKTGQALSRLLNLTDGLLGQGLNALVLITTNEPIARLHPAVTRPGRCLEKGEFGPLSKSAANEWLERQGSDKRVESEASLAELFAIARNLKTPTDVSSLLPRVGFGAVGT